ncbi:MAG: glycoside hydrolase family 2 TIM barrel-domain containing protein [Woeseia sp.]
MHYGKIAAAASILLLCISCSQGSQPASNRPSSAPPRVSGAGNNAAVRVEIKEEEGRYVLLRGGQPYEIKGAGIDSGDAGTLAAHGGNAFRTWGTDNARATGRQVLDEAAALGLTVAMCIDIGRERHGFDYDDEQAVAEQLAYARGEVLKYKDHPALLAWIIGNEPNLDFKNPKVFDAINDISEMIHDVDGNHPTTTALAGFSEELAGLLERRAPDLDLISIQMYAELVNLPRYIDAMSFDQPYFVTEWGTIGHWEVATTPWGAAIEQNSSEKARHYLTSYETAIAANPEQVVGNFVFLWGQKQERTPTWYGMFLEDGTETETVDVMHYIWNGAWPDNRSPGIESMLLASKPASKNVVLAAGEKYEASVKAVDPDGDALDYRWVIMRESAATQTGGDREEVPETLPGLIEGTDRHSVVVTAPGQPGAYRLFVYVYDGKGHAGHANIPFQVHRVDLALNSAVQVRGLRRRD